MVDELELIEKELHTFADDNNWTLRKKLNYFGTGYDYIFNYNEYCYVTVHDSMLRDAELQFIKIMVEKKMKLIMSRFN